MSAGKAILIGGIAFGVAAFLIHSKSASAASSATKQWPAGWAPPPNSTTDTIPAGTGNPTGLTLTITRWDQTADASGRAAGRWILVQNAGNPLGDWVVFFAGGTGPTPGSPVGIVQSSGSQNAGLIAQAVAAGLIE